MSTHTHTHAHTYMSTHMSTHARRAHTRMHARTHARVQTDKHVAAKFDERFKEYNEHCELLDVLNKPWAESGLEEEEYIKLASKYDEIKKAGAKGPNHFIT